MRMYGFSIATRASRVGHEVRRQVAAVELHAFDDVDAFGFEALALFDGDDAVLADAFIASARIVADRRVAVRRRSSPTCAIFLVVLDRLGLRDFFDDRDDLATAFSMPRFSAIGLAPAATVFMPSR
jgi:hypothetical protein